jgi:tetratricopeptide (TPR) repeat protein
MEKDLNATIKNTGANPLRKCRFNSFFYVVIVALMFISSTSIIADTIENKQSDYKSAFKKLYIEKTVNDAEKLTAMKKFKEASLLLDNTAIDKKYEAVIFTERANSLKKKGNYDAAIVFYRQALKRQPINPIVCSELGVCLNIREKPVEALRFFNMAEKQLQHIHNSGSSQSGQQNIDLKTIISNKITAYTDIGDNNRIISESLKYLKMGGKDKTVIHNLGYTYYIIGKKQEACRYMKQWLKPEGGFPGDRINLHKAQAYMILGEFAKSEKCLDEGKKINPADPEIYLNYGVMYFEMNKYAPAKQNFDKAIKMGLDPVVSAFAESYLKKMRKAP